MEVYIYPLIIQALTIRGSTASILGVFLYLINKNNYRLLKDMDEELKGILEEKGAEEESL